MIDQYVIQYILLLSRRKKEKIEGNVFEQYLYENEYTIFQIFNTKMLPCNLEMENSETEVTEQISWLMFPYSLWIENPLRRRLDGEIRNIIWWYIIIVIIII